MAVFVCGLDESSGSHHRDKFFMGGFVAPESEWSLELTPAWEQRVLIGPPRIPYLHMTDIRSQSWREEYGLSKEAADSRIDAAIDLLSQTNLTPIGIHVNAGEFRDHLSGTRIVHPAGGNAAFDPDYLCFFAYAYLTLSFVAAKYGDADRVDFVIEKNGRITKYIQAFHAGLAEALAALPRPDLAKLVGGLDPAGKERILLQAADVLCWHTARARENMDELDTRRYAKIARKIGVREELKRDHLAELAARLSQS